MSGSNVQAPNFIIHAAGSLGNRPDLGKRPYRLKCRFQVPAGSGAAFLERAKYLAADAFIEDMARLGYEWIGESHRLPPTERGFRMVFKGAHIEIMQPIKRKRALSSREMQAAVMQGATFRTTDDPKVQTVPHHSQAEFHDWELSTIFLHDTILVETPDAHEEIRPR